MQKINLCFRSALLVLLAGLGVACQHSSDNSSTTAPTNMAAPSPMAAASPAPAAAPEDNIPRVSVEEAKAALAKGEAIVIDVRGTDAFKLSHIKGAIDFPISRLEQGDFKGLPKSKQVIAYCSCPTEHTSGRAVSLLEKAGFKDARALRGGNTAWEASGGEMVKSSSH